jgi:glycosyltransferase involved in cell wall biosynthesis
MRFLLVHNFYRQRGGEDAVLESERRMLLKMGHDVAEYHRENREINESSLLQSLLVAGRTLWARDSYDAVSRILAERKFDVAIVYNFLPLVSPSVFYACREAGVPVLYHLPNYRLICPAATLYRDGHVCEECLDHSLWRSVLHGCYRDSRLATAPVAMMLAAHRWKQTWTEAVDGFFAQSEFLRRKVMEGGIPGEKIFHKPNFLEVDPGASTGRADFALCVGRLSPEKGLHTLLRAWSQLKVPVPLRIVGDGPLRAELEALATSLDRGNITFLGEIPRKDVLSLMKQTRLLVFPTECYEGFPITMVEAFACGAPPVASSLGAIEEIIDDGRTGLLFRPGDAKHLADRVAWAWSHPDELEKLGVAARAEYEAKYTMERNYDLLLKICEPFVSRNSGSSTSLPAKPSMGSLRSAQN